MSKYGNVDPEIAAIESDKLVDQVTNNEKIKEAACNLHGVIFKCLRTNLHRCKKLGFSRDEAIEVQLVGLASALESLRTMYPPIQSESP